MTGSIRMPGVHPITYCEGSIIVREYVYKGRHLNGFLMIVSFITFCIKALSHLPHGGLIFCLSPQSFRLHFRAVKYCKYQRKKELFLYQTATSSLEALPKAWTQISFE